MRMLDHLLWRLMLVLPLLLFVVCRVAGVAVAAFVV